MLRKLGIVGAGASLLIAMSPAIAFADNGPHVKDASLTTDSCAGCHRAHTASESYLLNQPQKDLCLTCHGPAAGGASTDVVSGVGYTDTGHGTPSAPKALRGGGFSYALIDSAGATKTPAKTIPALGTGTATTSAHSIDGTSVTAWGAGALGSATTGSSVTLECGSCHDPHGNGNYRILKPMPDGGTAAVTAQPVALSSIVFDHSVVEGTRTRYFYTFTTAAAHTFKATDPITVIGSTGTGGDQIGSGIYSVEDATHFTVRSNTAGISATGGTVGYAMPNWIASASGSGTTVTYRTWNVHGLVVGQKVTVTGLTPTGFNATDGVITGVPTTSTFTVANATGGASSGVGQINSTGIPDALEAAAGVGKAGYKKVYTTDDYWKGDDHFYSGASVTSGANPTAYIANVSQWCSSCHTRYMAGARAYATDSGDSTFRYRHRSQNGKEDSPNCIQCHVAHGSNASMDGPNSAAAGNTDPGAAQGSHAAASGVSRLLRVDNRGTCRMCHSQ